MTGEARCREWAPPEIQLGLAGISPTAVSAAIILSAAIRFPASISPTKGEMEACEHPQGFFCAGEKIVSTTRRMENARPMPPRISCGASGRMRTERSGLRKRPPGFGSVNRIADALARDGHRTKACRGSVDTLKRRLAEGPPVIVFIRIPGGTRCIYRASSLAERRQRIGSVIQPRTGNGRF